jgi:hypothetical protein
MFRAILRLIPLLALLILGPVSFARVNQLSSSAKGINSANAPVPTPLLRAIINLTDQVF